MESRITCVTLGVSDLSCSEAEVDRAFRELAGHGVRVVKAPEPTEWR